MKLKIRDEKEEVKDILVVEKYREIIDMVKPNLPLNSKVKIILGDIKNFNPSSKFDVIYFDIWNNVCGDNYSEMKELKSKFRKFLKRENTNKWIGCWREDDCRRDL